jgi:hypothetical protein
MTPEDLDSTLRRPARFWNIDGLPLIGMGAVWTLWGALALVSSAARNMHGSAARLVACWAWVPLLVVVSALNPVLKRIKARITVPRAGYMRVSRQNLWAARILAAAIACSVVVLLTYAQRHGFTAFERLLPAGSGLIMAGAFLLAARHHDLPSYAWVGLVALLAGVTNSALASSLDSFGWFFVAVGAACVVFGALDLRAFLKHHPVVVPEDLS